MCENSPNFVDGGTALHIGYKGASDEILISHVGIGKLREPVQITTGSCRFTFSHRLGQEQSFAKIKSMLERRHSGAPIGRGLLCRAGQSRRESGFP